MYFLLSVRTFNKVIDGNDEETSKIYFKMIRIMEKQQ